ncbi:MAG: M28 family peptidase [Gemmatimonadales bacterium]
MKLFVLFTTISITAAACGGIFSADGDVALDIAQIERDVRALAGDSTYGRGAGSVHEFASADFIRQRFIDLGLTVPSNGGYLQSFEVTGGKFVVTEQCSQSPPQNPQILTSQNVMGVLPGVGNLAQQWVIVSAHYDHLGCQVDADSVLIFNGADDNASGTAAMLDIARTLVDTWGGGGPPRRSMMFAAFGAEEPGLVGSRHFVEHPVIPMDSVVAVVNLDMVGRLRSNTLTIVGTSASDGWQAMLDAKNDARLTIVYDDTFLARGDHFSFINVSVPAAHFFTGTHDQYHTPLDDLPLVDFAGIKRVGDLALAVTRSLAFTAAIPRMR